MVSRRVWENRAVERVRETLDEHLAVLPNELIARISEGFYDDARKNIDPPHIAAALRRLEAAGVVKRTSSHSRGGNALVTIEPADRRGRATRIDRAAARKRLLGARYAGWAQSTKRHPNGLIGPAGERAVRKALLASEAGRPISPGASEVTTALGTRLRGPVDSGLFFVPTFNELPQPPITTLVEVKNIRSWIYPDSTELFQLLRKCVDLQRAHPDAAIVGLLACRKAHPRTMWMAKQLGFAVIEIGAQFVGDVDHELLDEVRVESGLGDLRVGDGPSLRVRDRLSSGRLPKLMPHLAETWRANALDRQIGQAILSVSDDTKRARRDARIVEQLTIQAGSRGWWDTAR